MNTHVLQHVPFEDVGSIAPWLAEQGAVVGYTRFFESSRLPAVRGLDLVIAMGGPMSVNDEASLPWLANEKQFLREAILHGVPVVGICLGAQLIASALGARVHPGPDKEIGWFDIEACPPAADCFRFPGRAKVFHWHGETFDLPPDAVRLARSEACENQAFQLGSKVIGLQFHLETTPESVEKMIANCRDELVAGPYVQSEAALRAAPDATFTHINALMNEVLAHVTRGSR